MGIIIPRGCPMRKFDKHLLAVAIGAIFSLTHAFESMASSNIDFVVDSEAVDALSECAASMTAAADYSHDAPAVAERVHRAMLFLSKVATNPLPDDSGRIPELTAKYATMLISNPMDARDTAQELVNGCLRSLDQAQAIRKNWQKIIETRTADAAEAKRLATLKVEEEAAKIKAKADAASQAAFIAETDAANAKAAAAKAEFDLINARSEEQTRAATVSASGGEQADTGATLVSNENVSPTSMSPPRNFRIAGKMPKVRDIALGDTNYKCPTAMRREQFSRYGIPEYALNICAFGSPQDNTTVYFDDDGGKVVRVLRTLGINHVETPPAKILENAETNYGRADFRSTGNWLLAYGTDFDVSENGKGVVDRDDGVGLVIRGHFCGVGYDCSDVPNSTVVFTFDLRDAGAYQKAMSAGKTALEKIKDNKASLVKF